MAEHRRRISLWERLVEGKSGHRVKRINNPGEMALRLFFIVTILLVIVYVVVLGIRQFSAGRDDGMLAPLPPEVADGN